MGHTDAPGRGVGALTVPGQVAAGLNKDVMIPQVAQRCHRFVDDAAFGQAVERHGHAGAVQAHAVTVYVQAMVIDQRQGGV